MDNLKEYIGESKIERSYNFVLDLETHIIQGNEEEQKADEQFDSVEFYHEYYKNLTPSDFHIKKEGNQIIIQIPSRSN